MNRAEILDTAKAYITVDRANTHGSAEANFGLIAAYWSAHLDARVTDHDVAVMMCLFKLVRMKSNPAHIDSSQDLCGYGAIAGELGAKHAKGKVEG